MLFDKFVALHREIKISHLDIITFVVSSYSSVKEKPWKGRKAIHKQNQPYVSKCHEILVQILRKKCETHLFKSNFVANKSGFEMTVSIDGYQFD